MKLRVSDDADAAKDNFMDREHGESSTGGRALESNDPTTSLPRY